MNPEKKIKDMTRKLADRREEVAGLKGEQQQILKQLQAEGCATVEEAESEAEKEQKKGEKLRSKLNTELAKLEKDYGWE